MSEKCSLCLRRGHKNNPLNRHHIRTKLYPEFMWVHSRTCHWFAEWVTGVYKEAGTLKELTSEVIICEYLRRKNPPLV